MCVWVLFRKNHGVRQRTSRLHFWANWRDGKAAKLFTPFAYESILWEVFEFIRKVVIQDCRILTAFTGDESMERNSMRCFEPDNRCAFCVAHPLKKRRVASAFISFCVECSAVGYAFFGPCAGERDAGDSAHVPCTPVGSQLLFALPHQDVDGGGVAAASLADSAALCACPILLPHLHGYVCAWLLGRRWVNQHDMVHFAPNGKDEQDREVFQHVNAYRSEGSQVMGCLQMSMRFRPCTFPHSSSIPD